MKIVLAVVIFIVAGVAFLRFFVVCDPEDKFEGEGQSLSEILKALLHHRIVRVLIQPDGWQKHGVLYVRRREIVFGVPEQSGTVEQAIDWEQLVTVLYYHMIYDKSHPLGNGRLELAGVARKELLDMGGTLAERLEWGGFRVRSAENVRQEHAELYARV